MTQPTERVFSGIQPTGDIHIGNYLGAIKKWVEISERYDSIFCIVDDHAITVDYNPAKLPRMVFEAALTGMACGLDPQKCTLFVQSHVPEHVELTWLFNTVTPLGSLFRMTQFKEKSRNALYKAIAKKEGEAQSSALYQIKSLGDATVKQLTALQPDLTALEPEGQPDEALIARINDGLGGLMQKLQVGLGVSEASAALFDYPVLQAADILLYKATLVPVGEDQEQHLELCREVAERFNRKFGDVFPQVHRIPGEAPRILGLDGKQKMSKSLDNHIGVLDEPKVIQKKLASAFTDPQRIRRSDPGRPEICNIFSLHRYFTTEGKREELEQGCRAGTIGCFDCKKELAGNIITAFEPIRNRADTFRQNPQLVIDALEAGRARSSEIASQTIGEVHQLLGLGRRALGQMQK